MAQNIKKSQKNLLINQEYNLIFKLKATKMDLTNALARAQKLILDEDFNNKVNQAAAIYSKGGGSAANGGSLASFEAAAFGDAYSSTQNSSGIELLQEAPTQRSPKKTKLPKDIQDSFTQMPPIGYEPAVTPPSYMFEQQSAPQYQPKAQPSAGVDYEYLKYIIDNAIKNALNNSGEEDAFIKGMRIKDGNVIQFLDTKGNLYEGVLKLKKKAK